MANQKTYSLPFGIPNGWGASVQAPQRQDNYYSPLTGYAGGQSPFAGILARMLGQPQQQAAAPKPVKIDKMPKDIRALTSMSSGRTMDSDGFLGGIFGPGGKAK